MRLLLYILRDDLSLNGPKFGCGLGQCGACTVLLNGEAARSCITPVGSVGEAQVLTHGLGTEAWQKYHIPQLPSCEVRNDG
jgi:nicotinate dehydrogenase subunit A